MSDNAQGGAGKLAMGLAALIAVMAAPSLVQAQTLTAEEQSSASILSTRALDAVKRLPASSSPSAFESAMLVTTHDYPGNVIVVAMNRVAGTPGIPGAAVDAAHHMQRAYTNDRGPRGEYDYYVGGSTPGLPVPGFIAGGQ